MNWIPQIQLDANIDNPGNILADGRVDRIRNTRFVGSISHTTYTLAALNLRVQACHPEAFIAAPALLPLDNPLNVPPSSSDIIRGSAEGAQRESKRPGLGGVVTWSALVPITRRRRAAHPK